MHDLVIYRGQQPMFMLGIWIKFVTYIENRRYKNGRVTISLYRLLLKNQNRSLSLIDFLFINVRRGCCNFTEDAVI